MRVALAGLLSLAGAVGLIGLASHSSSNPPAPVSSTSPSCVPPELNISAALAGARVTVSPGPDTRDASAQTQISLLGVPASELARITVSGSRSGAHGGRLRAYSEGDGASFVPTRPFAEGERVSVRGELREAGRAVPLAWSFTVAVRDRKEAASGVPGSTPAPPKPREYQSFHSRPTLRPPLITTAKSAHAASDDLFIAPYSGVGQYGPMILDPNGGLLWFKQIPAGARAADFRVQRYDDKPVLTWWQDPLVAGANHKAGDVIADGAYKTIAVVRAGNGYQADLHEFQISPRGTALITVYNAIDCNLSALGGPRDGAVADTLFQQIDLKTGLVMYEWHSLDHVSLASSYSSARPGSRAEPFDYFHINSTDPERDGDLLVDARETWAAYDVDPRTGQVRWQLGGKHSSFKLGPGASTAWQHDAREQPNGAITFFDNGATPAMHPQSRAIEIVLDKHAMVASLVRRYEHRNRLVAGSQGNVQALADGDWVVGWGEAGYLSEVEPSGHVRFNAHLPAGWESYRAYAFSWHGQPPAPPALAVTAGAAAGSRAVVYASWNGATEVSSWRVLAGSSPSALVGVATAPKAGFETAIKLPEGAAGPYFAVQALNGFGAPLGTSAAVRLSAAP